VAKTPNRYLKVDPWAIIEEGFHPEQGRVSESIFSLANEYMGLRGYFDEGYSGDTLVGSYLNGVFEERTFPPEWMRGVTNRTTTMVNSVDWVYTRLTVDGEQLDLAKSKVTDFTRCLDLKAGLLTRSFTWHTASGKTLKVAFSRFVSMDAPHLGCQRVTFQALDFSGPIEVTAGLDFSPIHEDFGNNIWTCPRKGSENGLVAILGQTEKSGHRVFSSFRLGFASPPPTEFVAEEKFAGLRFALPLKQGEATSFDKMVVNLAEKDRQVDTNEVWRRGLKLAAGYRDLSFDAAAEAHRAYWRNAWETLDVTIDGHPADQQGVRFCIFQLHQTYHGQNPDLNIGAKGLTGEIYWGATFWDTETYCLPFYLFSNLKAAKNLLLFRHHTLPQARQRALELDCRGACYPFVTIDGTESCRLWQHGNLQVHATAAVAYAVWHYVNVSGDTDFLHRQGIEMMLEICRYFASRGGWNSRTGEYGLFGVMGPDEYHMMVHNNCYTNHMVKKVLERTLAVMEAMQREAPDLLAQASKKVALDPAEPRAWQTMAEKMRIPLQQETGIYEQHDGYFDMPHMDLTTLDQFPIYDYWAYDRIFRYDMIKQPDVVLMMFLYSHDFSLEAKRINYHYYAARCIHESSLSPAVHSIMAAEVGNYADAVKYARYGNRLDLDNYNRNTREGLHTTSLAAAWMNVVYGFGGMRSDGELLSFSPTMPGHWRSLSFRLLYRGAVLEMTLDHESVAMKVLTGPAVPLKLYGQHYSVGADGVRVSLPAERVSRVLIPE
jgi:maltose phosphorylase